RDFFRSNHDLPTASHGQYSRSDVRAGDVSASCGVTTVPSAPSWCPSRAPTSGVRAVTSGHGEPSRPLGKAEIDLSACESCRARLGGVDQKRSVRVPEMSQSADPFDNPRATAPVNFSALMILYSAPTRISSGLSWPGAMAVAPSKNAKTEKGCAIA